MRYFHVLPPPHLSTSWTLPYSLVLWMHSPRLSPSLVNWIPSSLSYSRESDSSHFFDLYCKTKFSLSCSSFPFVHRQIVNFFLILRNAWLCIPHQLPPQLSTPSYWRCLKIFPLCLYHSTFGATPITFSPWALIDAALIGFTDNHNVDKACDYLNLTYQ